MTRFSYILFTAGVAIWFSACSATEEGEFERRRSNQFGYRGGSGTEYQSVPNLAPAQPDVVPSAPSPTPEPESEITPPPVVVQEPVKKDYQYGAPVPGKPGFVTSPHAPYSGYVDVRGFPPGTEVKDPYSGKIFLVP